MVLDQSTYPGPRYNPLIGWRGLVVQFAKDPIRYLTNLHNKYGNLAYVGKGDWACAFTFHPEFTRTILSDPSVFYSYELESVPFPFTDSKAIDRLTTALALMNGERHKQQRRLMMPAFHNKRLEEYHYQIVEVTEKIMSNWKSGDVRDIYQEMDLLSIYFSVKIMIGMNPDEEGLRFGNMFEQTMRALFNPASFLFPYDIPGLPYKKLLKYADKLENDLEDLIVRRKNKGLDAGDALSMLIAANDEDGTKLTDDELMGQTVALFRGGSKTTASALTWTLFLLAMHPHILHELMEELEGTLDGNPPTIDQLKQLPYTEAVINESMRLIPPVIWGIRYSVEPFELGGFEFDKGSKVMYSAQITHRLPEIYSMPDNFEPKRWFEISPSAYEYFPFSAGPRLCLGATFAMMAMKISLAMILQRYKFTLPENTRINRVGIIGSLPKNGIPMLIETQNKEFIYRKVNGDINKLVNLGV